MDFKKGTKVRQIVKIIEGEVAGFQIDQESGERQILVAWTDSEGVQHSRYFGETQIEPILED